jgi:hypothetical protein
MRGNKEKMAHYPGEILYRMLTRRNEERYGECKQHKMSKKPITLATTYTLSIIASQPQAARTRKSNGKIGICRKL